MFQVKQNETTAIRRRIPVLLVDATDGYTPETGITGATITVSKNGSIVSAGVAGRSLTEVGNGIYWYGLGDGTGSPATANEINDLGWVSVNVSATGCRNYNAIVQIMAYDAMDSTGLGLSRIDTNIGSRQATVTFPANFGDLAITASTGRVTVGTNADKTNYSLSAGSITSSTFDSGAITNTVLASGAISNSTFASNAIGTSTIASGAITSSSFGADAITASALASDAAEEIANTVWQADNDTKYGGGQYDADSLGRTILRSSNTQAEVDVNGNNHVSAVVHQMQTDVLTATALAADAVIEIAQGILTEATSTNTAVYAAGDVGNVLGRLHNMIAADGADFQYTANALELAPSGGGGGGTSYASGNLPYQVKAEQQFPTGIVDIITGTLLRLDLQVLDRDNNPINLTGATVTVGLRNATTGATIGTDQSATLSFARMGMIYVDTIAAWSATVGTYRLTVSATVGSDVIVAGPLSVVVRSR